MLEREALGPEGEQDEPNAATRTNAAAAIDEASAINVQGLGGEENPDEIDLDEPTEAPKAKATNDLGLVEKEIPDAVFGGIKAKAEAAALEKQKEMGARERFKARGK